MAKKPAQVLLGARIPAPLKKELDSHCSQKGLKMNFFVSEAIQDKLSEVEQQQKGADPKLILPKIKQDILTLAPKYGVHNIRVFGSVARGDSGPGSDLDLLIQMDKNRSLFDMVGFQNELQDKTGVKIDIAEDDDLSPYIRDRVKKEAIPL